MLQIADFKLCDDVKNKGITFTFNKAETTHRLPEPEGLLCYSSHYCNTLPNLIIIQDQYSPNVKIPIMYLGSFYYVVFLFGMETPGTLSLSLAYLSVSEFTAQ